MPTFQFSYNQLPIDSLQPRDRDLALSAIEAISTNTATYSKFGVGAAVLLDNGVVVKGSNQENASYPCGTCAERAALFYAQGAYQDSCIMAIAIAARQQGNSNLESTISPCGMCRQAILEAEVRQGLPIRILLVGQELTTIVNSAKDLLPFSFEG